MTVLWTIVTVAALLPHIVRAADDAEGDPHWNKATCQTCHVDTVPSPDNHTLRTEDAEQLCEECHGDRGSALPCRHTSDISASDHPMPDSYRETLKEGRLACTTCHDLTVQCLSPSRSYSFANPGFIRDRSSRKKGEHCFQCHDASGYEQLNPHAMEADDPVQPTCTFCHASMPMQDERGWLAVDFHMPDTLNDICLGCHKVRPHPGSSFSGKPIGWEHLAIPSAEILENMRQSEQTRGLIFPLDPNNGEIHCATCHNPHHDALQGYPVANPQGTNYRLRVDDICQACHDM